MGLTVAVATATEQVGVALGGPDGLRAELRMRAGRRHGESLAPALRALADLAGVSLADCSRVAVDVGPGLFTGLRVGVATAKALASGLGVPVAGRSSLAILAHPHRHTGRPVAAVVDARRGEVFWSLYRPGGEVLGPEVVAPGDLARRLEGEAGLIVTGDGARRYLAGDGPWTLAGPEHDHPSPAALLDLVADDPGADPATVTPLYLRGADVRIGWEQR